MWAESHWKDYELIDSGNGMRLEHWGRYTLSRPDPVALWRPTAPDLWEKANAVYHRSSAGGGKWDISSLPDNWKISYDSLSFIVKPMGFKHTGVFPEQAVNWDWARNLIRGTGHSVRVLNLFAYTGGATLAAAQAGASVCHVDAAKGIVLHAKENAVASGLSKAPIRWIVDDCRKFISREIRRGNQYDAIILDPPSYGRGAGGEVWKIEEDLYPFLEDCVKLLSDNPVFFLLNSYTAGLSPKTGEYVLSQVLRKYHPSIEADEIGLPCRASGRVLPCGSAIRVTF